MMTEPKSRIGQFFIEVGGRTVAPEIMDQLDDALVEDDLEQPAMFALRFNDPQLNLMNGETFRLGSEVKLAAANPAGERQPLLIGEVTALEPRFEQNHITLTVRGYDRGHRLRRSSKVRTFLKQGDDDIVRQIARENGLRADVDAPGTRYGYMVQHNQTDFDFLRERAARIGYQMSVEDRTLRFRRAEQSPPAAKAQEWGATLLSFQVRLSAVAQADEVQVRGWDPQLKQAIVGTAKRPVHASALGGPKNGGEAAQQAFGAPAALIVTDLPVGTQAEAELYAQALLDEHTGDYLTAEGRALGEPSLRAGSTVAIENLGKQFKGRYFITATRHEYTAHDGYMTTFYASGRRPTSLFASLQTEQARAAAAGVVIGLVTNINDPDKLGRVRVTFPWLSEQHETDWVRVAQAGAGAGRGWQIVPEVDDEVVLAFEHGDVNRPYVLGGLWNGKDQPPLEAVQAGKVQKRTLTTRAGHSITLYDDDGAGKIEIKTARHTVTLDDAGTGKITFESGGDVELKGTGGALSISAQGVELRSQSSLKVQASAMLDVQASGVLTIKGSMVNIN
jgi:uncharacterized protein involved in type VI secretion and phage assembly